MIPSQSSIRRSRHGTPQSNTWASPFSTTRLSSGQTTLNRNHNYAGRQGDWRQKVDHLKKFFG